MQPTYLPAGAVYPPGYPAAPAYPPPAYQQPIYPVQPQQFVQAPTPPPTTYRPPAVRPPQLPIIRAQADDTPPLPPSRPARVELPSAEALGVRPPDPAAARADVIDWATVHRRLAQLGATCFHIEKLSEGQYRITCLLQAEPGRDHRIESVGASEGDAVRLTMNQVERWAAGR